MDWNGMRAVQQREGRRNESAAAALYLAMISDPSSWRGFNFETGAFSSQLSCLLVVVVGAAAWLSRCYRAPNHDDTAPRDDGIL
jgi:hypothetical protein